MQGGLAQISLVRFILLTTHRNEFERNLALDKKDFGAIEFLLRKGHRQLEMYAQPGIKDIHR